MFIRLLIYLPEQPKWILVVRRGLRLTSRRRDAQQLCLIFQTTAATRSRDKKQLWTDRQKKRQVKKETKTDCVTADMPKTEPWDHTACG